MGIPTLISTATITSATANVSITSGITSSYDEYMFVVTDYNPSSDGQTLFFNGSTDSGSNYNVTKTTTFFRARHDEGDGTAELAYQTGEDLAQGTGFQEIAHDVGSDADQSCAGILHLFNPASTVYVKHFYWRFINAQYTNQQHDIFGAGYMNTTSAVDAVQFKSGSGNIDNVVIQMYGIA